MPCHQSYYAELTSGARSMHIEDLRPDHLPFLDQLRLADYDPSVSPKLTPRLIRRHCRVHFTWRP